MNGDRTRSLELSNTVFCQAGMYGLFLIPYIRRYVPESTATSATLTTSQALHYCEVYRSSHYQSMSPIQVAQLGRFGQTDFQEQADLCNCPQLLAPLVKPTGPTRVSRKSSLHHLSPIDNDYKVLTAQQASLLLLTTKPSCRGLNAAAKGALLVIEDLYKKAKEAKLVL